MLSFLFRRKLRKELNAKCRDARKQQNKAATPENDAYWQGKCAAYSEILETL